MPKWDQPGVTREQLERAHRDHGVDVAPHGGDATSSRDQQPSFVDTMEKHARFWSAVQKIAVGVLALVAFLGSVAGVVYKVVSFAAAEQFAIFAARIDPAAIIQTKAEEDIAKDRGFAPMPKIAERFAAEAAERERVRSALTANTARDTAADMRADVFDGAIRLMFPARSNRIALPPIGPTAAAQGRQ